jgi:23S rRNA (cytosine1962-C5)-methyltransferase
VWIKSPTTYPILFKKRIARVDPQAKPGDCVAIYGPGDELLGYGLYNPRSEIAVRVLRWGAELPDDAFFEERLASAAALRRDLLRLDETTDAYRVIHAEADGFSGLVVDRYADILSAEAFSLGMYQRADAILARLERLCGTKHRIIRPSPQFVSQEGVAPLGINSADVPEQVVVTEHGTKFRVRFEGGHKTGFFCDQRENRRRLADFCYGRSVLDLCCYTGGFAIQAKRLGGAGEVVGVDLDEEPLAIARENANLNQLRGMKFVQSDVFPFMRDLIREGKRYDIVVLDPPKLIRSRIDLEEGTRKHFDLNRLAAQCVTPGGLLLTCTCAGLLDKEEFLKTVYAAIRTGPVMGPDETRLPGRTLQILARTGAAADHPVSLQVPETEYLHAIWARVM